MDGSVRRIHVVPEQGAPPEPVESVEAVAGAGLRDDRYFDEDGTFTEWEGADLTLIEAETIDAARREDGVTIDPGTHRRNVTTVGISLNDYVGERLQVGGAVCVGTALCEPCSYLEQLVGVDGVREALVNRGGLRCRIVESGEIRVGDDVSPP